ncbi:MAG: hypothetical protein RIC06_10455 [Cyclobacteriaceae bacterium]
MKTIIPSLKLPGISMTFCILVALSSCLRIDQIEQINSQPIILINGQKSLIRDSMKLTNDGRQYPVEITVEDPDFNQKSISFEILSGQGYVFQNGISINEIQLDKYENLRLSYSPNRTGTHILSFNAVDAFDQSSSNNLEVFVFDNFLPIAQFELVKPEVQHDPLEYQIDTSNSYDPDAKFGGRITSYEYSFLGKIVEISKSSIGIIFPKPGIYDIGLRVKDNNEEWGAVTMKSIKVN